MNTPRKCCAKSDKYYDENMSENMNHFKKTICVLGLVLSAYGCQLPSIYRIDVQQGNALEAELVEKITLDMNKEQVRFILGTPLIVDSFHPDRWDYVYLLTPSRGEQQRSQLTIIFDRDEVIDIVKRDIADAVEDGKGAKDSD